MLYPPQTTQQAQFPSQQLNTELSLEEGLAQFDINLQQSLLKLQQSGFYLPHEPTYSDGRGSVISYRGELPPDLTVLTDAQLGWHLTMLSSWSSYVQVKLAEADLNRTNSADKLDFLEAKLRSKMLEEKPPEGGKPKKRLSNPEADAVVKCDRRYVELKTAFNYHEATYKMIRAAAHSAESNWNTVSRRITQRGQEIERDRRSGGGGNLPAGPLFPPRRPS